MLLCAEVPAPYKDRGTLEQEKQEVRKACRFDRALLQACSGMGDTSFGYKEGKPCMIVKLNRIVNFRPKVASASALQPSFTAPQHCRHKTAENK